MGRLGSASPERKRCSGATKRKKERKKEKKGERKTAKERKRKKEKRRNNKKTQTTKQNKLFFSFGGPGVCLFFEFVFVLFGSFRFLCVFCVCGPPPPNEKKTKIEHKTKQTPKNGKNKQN